MFLKDEKCYSCMYHVCMYIRLLFFFFPVQNHAKRFLIETEDDADALKSDEFGYGDQNKDEEAFKHAIKPRREGRNRSPPKPKRYL